MPERDIKNISNIDETNFEQSSFVNNILHSELVKLEKWFLKLFEKFKLENFDVLWRLDCCMS